MSDPFARQGGPLLVDSDRSDDYANGKFKGKPNSRTPVQYCSDAGHALLYWSAACFFASLTVATIWALTAFPDLMSAAHKANDITSAVAQRTDMYLNQTDALMVYLTPNNVAGAWLSLLPYVGDAISKLSAAAGADVNMTKLAFALEDIVDMFASTAANTRRNGLTLTVLPPDPSAQRPSDASTAGTVNRPTNLRQKRPAVDQAGEG